MPGRDLTFDLLRGGAVLYIIGYYHIQDVWLVHLPRPLAGWLARITLALFAFCRVTCWLHRRGHRWENSTAAC